LRDRKILSQDGLIIIVVAVESQTGRVVSPPDIISRGFVYVRESEDLIDEARKVIQAALDNCDPKSLTQWNYLKSVMRDSVKEFVWQKTKRNPMILPIVMQV
jgi:ribonuclease J